MKAATVAVWWKRTCFQSVPQSPLRRRDQPAGDADGHGHRAEHLCLEMLMRQHPGEAFSCQSASGKDASFKVL